MVSSIGKKIKAKPSPSRKTGFGKKTIQTPIKMAKTPVKALPSSSSGYRIKRTPIPDFSKIHAKQFLKMKSIVDYAKPLSVEKKVGEHKKRIQPCEKPSFPSASKSGRSGRSVPVHVSRELFPRVKFPAVSKRVSGKWKKLSKDKVVAEDKKQSAKDEKLPGKDVKSLIKGKKFVKGQVVGGKKASPMVKSRLALGQAVGGKKASPMVKSRPALGKAVGGMKASPKVKSRLSLGKPVGGKRASLMKKVRPALGKAVGGKKASPMVKSRLALGQAVGGKKASPMVKARHKYPARCTQSAVGGPMSYKETSSSEVIGKYSLGSSSGSVGRGKTVLKRSRSLGIRKMGVKITGKRLSA